MQSGNLVNRTTFFQMLMVVSILVLAPVAGVLVAAVNPIFILVAVVLPVILIVLHTGLPHLEFGPIVILIAAAFIPIYLPTGTESRLVDSFLLTLLFVGQWILTMIIVDKRLSLKPYPTNAPLLGFIGVTLFSIIWSNAFRDPLADPNNLSSKFAFVQLASGFTMVMLPGAFLLVANHINDIKLLKIMVIIMIIAGIIAGIVRLRELDLPETIRVNDGGLFSMWIVGISIGLALFVRKMDWKIKISLLTLGSLWLYLRFFLGVNWLGGWLPSLIVLGILSLMRSKKLFAVVLIIGAIYIFANSNYYFGTVLDAETNESGNTRLAAWEANWRVTGKHLLFGTGPAGYAVYYMSYFPDGAMATHNSLIDTLAQTGIVGLTLIFWFFGALIWRGYKLCLRLKGRGDFSEAMANIAFAGTIGTFIMAGFGDWLFPFTYTQTIAGFDYVVYSWLFMGLIPVLDYLTISESKIPTYA